MGSITAMNFDAPPKETVKPVSLAHVVLRTSNKNRLRDYYCTFLGATVRHENDHLAFLTYDEEHHRIAIVQVPGTADKNQRSCGLEHIAFTHASLTDLCVAYKQRINAGLTPPVWCVNHGPTTSMYWRDPDGNTIETQVDNFDDADSATEYMLTPEFAENPFGADFVPEELMARIQKGESDESLKKRPDVGPRSLPEFLI